LLRPGGRRRCRLKQAQLRRSHRYCPQYPPMPRGFHHRVRFGRAVCRLDVVSRIAGAARAALHQLSHGRRICRCRWKRPSGPRWRAAGPVSLYLHIPYCQEICWYCGCNTGAANRGSRLSAYLGAAPRDRTGCPCHRARGRITRIAFGGEPQRDFADRLRPADRYAHAEFPLARPVLSLELDPRSLAPQWFTAFAASG
jgi:coproporphyrinogen III oxidase-like Fe-S oxidoreductase